VILRLTRRQHLSSLGWLPPETLCILFSVKVDSFLPQMSNGRRNAPLIEVDSAGLIFCCGCELVHSRWGSGSLRPGGGRKAVGSGSLRPGGGWKALGSGSLRPGGGRKALESQQRRLCRTLPWSPVFFRSPNKSIGSGGASHPARICSDGTFVLFFGLGTGIVELHVSSLPVCPHDRSWLPASEAVGGVEHPACSSLSKLKLSMQPGSNAITGPVEGGSLGGAEKSISARGFKTGSSAGDEGNGCKSSASL